MAAWIDCHPSAMQVVSTHRAWSLASSSSFEAELGLENSRKPNAEDRGLRDDQTGVQYIRIDSTTIP